MVVVLAPLEVGGRKWKEGPQVDPGVFVITHIRSCRNGAGYCILGIKCSVDSDFVEDDSGGDCNSLSAAFSPQATFVCCKENPENFETDGQEEIINAIILEHNTAKPTTTSTTLASSTELQTQTSIVTEIVTELQTEFATKIEEVTEVFTEVVTENINKNKETANVSQSADKPLIIQALDPASVSTNQTPEPESTNEIAESKTTIEISESEYTDLEELLLG